MSDARLLVGTSGYAYKEWKGTFYPESLPQKGFLRYYAGRFATVEINNTFYRMPSEQTICTWRDTVPDGFEFALKVSRRITHFKRLQDTGDDMDYILRTASHLGNQLGPLLFQLPPNFHADLDRLRAFLDTLPSNTRAAFEFRHDSWDDPAVRDALQSRNAALVTAETDDDDTVAVHPTAAWGYFRLRKTAYTDGDLAAWKTRILDAGFERAYVFFKHEGEGTGPAFVQRFTALDV